eukprot:m.6057 g.6057  ORF g.6057 m.6057 type:complete len:171 (-) comp2535_c0_seq1:45-557(-)
MSKKSRFREEWEDDSDEDDSEGDDVGEEADDSAATVVIKKKRKLGIEDLRKAGYEGQSIDETEEYKKFVSAEQKKVQSEQQQRAQAEQKALDEQERHRKEQLEKQIREQRLIDLVRKDEDEPRGSSSSDKKVTGKDKVKQQRLRGHSGIGDSFRTWRSDTEMQQRQMFDS